MDFYRKGQILKLIQDSVGGCFPQIGSQKCYELGNPIGRVVQGLWRDYKDGSNLEVQAQSLSSI